MTLAMTFDSRKTIPEPFLSHSWGFLLVAKVCDPGMAKKWLFSMFFDDFSHDP